MQQMAELKAQQMVEPKDATDGGTDDTDSWSGNSENGPDK